MISDIEEIADKCHAAAQRMAEDRVQKILSSVAQACDELGSSWSGGWLGYHSRVYTADLKPKRPGQYFDTEWGNLPVSQTTGDWLEYDLNFLIEEIFKSSKTKAADFDECQGIAFEIGDVFEEARDELVAILASLKNAGHEFASENLDAVKKLQSHISAKDIAKQRIAGATLGTRDPRAGNEGVHTPAHIHIKARVFEFESYASQCEELSKFAKRILKYIERVGQLGGRDTQMQGKKVFIGHGRSRAWKDLKDFLTERLKLEFIEFNRTPSAGVATTERLSEMLNDACFAFLVMTGEDAHEDGSVHARENVVHEAGLFQGRLGFKKAIVLLEEGCEEFSNISGLGQIRFPKDKIGAASEEIRRVLEREGVI